MARVLIADDHAVVRAGYRQFLETDPSIIEVGEAATGNDTLKILRLKKWDLLLMDISMPDRGGLDILKHVITGYPATRVLFMSGLPEEPYAREVIRAGASGYLSKGGSAEEFLRAVRRVLSGHRYVSEFLAESMAAELTGDLQCQRLPHTQLSSREFQIFCKLAASLSVRAIAKELNLSMKTISTYRSRITQTMGVDSDAEIVAYALRHGLIQ
jgi:two-component system, NarL family, invasion response regulator UvrY